MQQGNNEGARIYAGNAIATVKAPSSLRVKFFTVRSTAFKAAPVDDADQADAQAVEAVEVLLLSVRKWVLNTRMGHVST